MKNSGIFFGIFLVTLFVTGTAACKEEPDPKTTTRPTEYTVSFHIDDGPAVPEQPVAEGGKVTEPNITPQDGFTLDGWYREPGFGTKWNFAADTVSSDITLYARWIPDEPPPEQPLPPRTPGTLYVFELGDFLNTLPADKSDYYDYHKLATALQGLANRYDPQIYYIYKIYAPNSAYGDRIDQFWLDHLSGGGRYLSSFEKDISTYPPTSEGFFTLLGDFSAFYKGFVIWDPDVPATANLASTIAGADRLLPVPNDSPLYEALFGAEGEFSTDDIKINLAGKFTGTGRIPDITPPVMSTRSKKNDAYLWAKYQYLDKGKTNPLQMAYCTDSWIKTHPSFSVYESTLPNADYHIAVKAFFWDLSPDHRIAPIDDRNQQTREDVTTLESLLYSQAVRSGFNIFNVSGFPPWNYKYSSFCDPASTMEPTYAEWTMVNRISSYGGQKEADANAGIGDVSNLSVLSHVPLNAEFKQKNRGESRNDMVYDPDTSYITIYMGDYDQGSWASSMMVGRWEYSTRTSGEYPLSWSIPMGVSDRIPHVFNYVYENATDNDYFVACDNGTAYLNATMLETGRRASGLPNTMLATWENYNRQKGSQFDIDVLGFYINTNANTLATDFISSDVLALLSRMYPVGVSYQAQQWLNGEKGEIYYHEDGDKVTPFVLYSDGGNWTNTPQEIADDIYGKIHRVGQGGSISGRHFYYLRCVLVEPEKMYAAFDILKTMPNVKFEVVDPYTLFRLARDAKEQL